MRMLWELILFLCWSSSKINTTFVIFFLGGKFHPIKSAHVWLTIQVFVLCEIKSNDFKVVQELFYLTYSKPIYYWTKHLNFFWLTFLLTTFSIPPSVRPSIRLSITQHISGTVHHLYCTHMWNEDISRSSFISSKFWFFGLLGR